MEFKIIKHIDVIEKKTGGWNKEINIVKWGEHEPKLDIRDWNEDHTKCGKGITLTDEAAAALAGILKERL
jgi:hypothetical protein